MIKYIITYVIPDAIAFYLANGYSRNCLSDCPLINHINSAIDVFNVRCDTDKLIPEKDRKSETNEIKKCVEKLIYL